MHRSLGSIELELERFYSPLRLVYSQSMHPLKGKKKKGFNFDVKTR